MSIEGRWLHSSMAIADEAHSQEASPLMLPLHHPSRLTRIPLLF